MEFPSKARDTIGPFHEGLVTSVDAITYDFRARRGVIWIPPDCCTSMGGAIKLLRKIDPRVGEIRVMAGAELDIVYRRLRGRTWQATDRRGVFPAGVFP